MRARAGLLMVPLLLFSAGCGDDGGGGGGGGDGGAGVDGSGGGGGGDGGGPSACKKVDLVISIDPSGSMTEELEAIADPVFPLLADKLIEVSGGLQDFRVGVMDACPNPATFHTRGQNTGACGFSSGEVWMESASSDLEGEFACVGDLYEDDIQCTGDNDDEQPASAAAQALEPPFIAEENAGFLREDALLVVMAITDEDEQPCDVLEDPSCEQTPATAQEVYDRLVAIKGDVRKMVFYGIGGGVPGGCDDGTYGSADPAEKLHDVTQLFIDQDRGVWKDLCQGNLEDGIDDVIEVVESACDEFPEIE